MHGTPELLSSWLGLEHGMSGSRAQLLYGVAPPLDNCRRGKGPHLQVHAQLIVRRLCSGDSSAHPPRACPRSSGVILGLMYVHVCVITQFFIIAQLDCRYRFANEISHETWSWWLASTSCQPSDFRTETRI